MSTTYPIRNVAKVVADRIRGTGKIHLTFPNSDYMVAGKVWSGKPTRRLKPTIAKDGTVTVRFNSIIWKVVAEAITVMSVSTGQPLRRKDGTRYKAVILLDPEFLRYV